MVEIRGGRRGEMEERGEEDEEGWEERSKE